jgi:uncharacterized protein YycO
MTFPSTANREPRTANLSSGRVLLFRAGGPIGKLIGWQTRSPYSHAALLDTDGITIIEAMQGHGVRRRPLTLADLKHCDVFDVANLTADGWERALQFAHAEVGSGYDYRSIFRFLTRRAAGSDTRWFCSELVFAALQEARVNLLERTHAWAVAPGHLAWSPLLIQTTLEPRP